MAERKREAKKTNWTSVDRNGYDWNSGEEFAPTTARTVNGHTVGPNTETVPASTLDARPAQTEPPRAVRADTAAASTQTASAPTASAPAVQTVPTQNRAPKVDAAALRGTLDNWLSSAQSAQERRVDEAAQQGVSALREAQTQAEARYQTQQDQIDLDASRARDNQALYAAARGDRGGIGAAQYDSIQNTAARNRAAINSARTRLATDTAQSMARLRAQGEYEKADSLLQLTQQYLSRLMSLEQWAAEYNLSADRFNAGLDQWAANFNEQLRQADLSAWQWQTKFDYQSAVDARDYARSVYEDTRDYDRSVYEADRKYSRAAYEDDRDYGRSVYEADRKFNRAAYEDDRDYDRSVYESDRKYRRAVYEDNRDAALAERKFEASLRQQALENGWSEQELALKLRKFEESLKE